MPDENAAPNKVDNQVDNQTPKEGVRVDNQDAPPLDPGEVITSRTVNDQGEEVVRVESSQTMYDAPAARKLSLQQAEIIARNHMAAAANEVLTLLAREGLVVNEEIIAGMVYAPFGAAIHLALSVETDSPVERSVRCHTIMDKCFNAVKNGRHFIRKHFVRVIEENKNLTPQQQADRDMEILEKAHAEMQLRKHQDDEAKRAFAQNMMQKPSA